MKVVLVSGFEVEISIEAFRLYKKRSGLELFAYEAIEENGEHTGAYLHISDEMVIDYEPMYRICNKYLGETASQEDVDNNAAEGIFDDRTDPVLISVIEELGGRALSYSGLSIAEIPDGIEWHIELDMDTFTEWVEEGPPREPRRRWYGEPVERIWE